MTPICLAFRSGLRSRWRAALGLALLLGLAGGVALTAAAGARRTATAYPRLLRWSSAANVQVIPGCTGLRGFYAALARLPQVASMSTEVVYTLAVPGRGGGPAGQLEAIASPDGTLGTATDRVRIVAGHRPPATDPADVMVDPQLAAQQRVRPGSTLHLTGVPSTAKVCPAQLAPARPGLPVPLAFRVSAVASFDDQVVPAPGLGGAPRVLLSPGFWRSGAGRRFGPGDEASVRLRPGSTLAAFRAAASRLARHYPSAGGLGFVNLAPQQAAVQRAIHPAAVALALFAALAALLTLAVVSPLIVRQFFLDAVEFPAFRALGMTRTQLLGLCLARAAAVTAGGALIAVSIAVAASPLMPIGVARQAEPSPGVQLDPALLAAGLAVTVFAPLVLVVPVAWRMAGPAHPGGPGRAGRPARPSWLAAAVAQAGSLTAALGIRMAFEPGRGRSAVPVRSALAASTVALAALLAAAVFGTSLLALVSTPHRYGQNWTQELDLQLAGVPAARVSRIAAQPGVRGYAAGDYGQLGIDGQAVPAVGVDPLHGRDFLTLLAGRPASGTRPDRAGRADHARRGLAHRPAGPGPRQRDHPAAPDYRGGHVPALQPGHRHPDRPGHGCGRDSAAALGAGPAAVRGGQHLLQLRPDPLPPRHQPARRRRPAGGHRYPGRLPAWDLPAGQRPEASRHPRLHVGAGHARWLSALCWPCSRWARSPMCW